MTDTKAVGGTTPPAAATPMAAAGAGAGASASAATASPPRTCASCGALSAAGAAKRCSACRGAFYCSVACQKAHWPAHKRTCELGAVSAAAQTAGQAGDTVAQSFATEQVRHSAALHAVVGAYTTAIDALMSAALVTPVAVGGGAAATATAANHNPLLPLSAADCAILARLKVERARAYMACSEDAKCSADVTSALTLDPNNVSAYVLAAEHALRQTNGADTALKRANEGLVLAPEGAERTALQALLQRAQQVVYAKQLKESSGQARAYTRQTGCPTYNFAVVVVRHPGTGKYLAVKETRNRGWWLPAGFVDPGEDMVAAAHRETWEEAGLRVTLKGVLRVEHSVNGAYSARLRVVFYAEPTDPNAPPKSVADAESECAQWVSVAELRTLRLRGDELLVWAQYLDGGGTVYPLSVVAQESDAPPKPSAAAPVKIGGVGSGGKAGCTSM